MIQKLSKTAPKDFRNTSGALWGNTIFPTMIRPRNNHETSTHLKTEFRYAFENQREAYQNPTSFLKAQNKPKSRFKIFWEGNDPNSNKIKTTGQKELNFKENFIQFCKIQIGRWPLLTTSKA